ncbi:hypothetical protein Bca101_044112 [Brassica carinata]
MNLVVAILDTLLLLSLREMITDDSKSLLELFPKQRLMLFDLMSSGSVVMISVICCVDVRREVKILRALSGHDITFLSSMMHMRIMTISI